MLNVIRCVVPSAEQWQITIEGVRNSFNSWLKSDSHIHQAYIDTEQIMINKYLIGPNDMELLKKLLNSRPERKFLRMLPVIMDIKAPLYFWKQCDTYKIGTTRNSCSTMHTITSKPLEITDFCTDAPEINDIIKIINNYRDLYLKERDDKYWKYIIQLLPDSYMQYATLSLNYEVLANIYHYRKHHKLTEWHDLCNVIEQLPYAKELICNTKNDR